MHDNDDDGIDVRGTGTRLKDNRADDNGDFGGVLRMRRLTTAVALAVTAAACTGCAMGLTGSPEVVSDHDARVVGMVVSNADGQVEYWAEYGPTQTYGSATTHETVATTQNAMKTVKVTIPGLSRSTSYHYRVCAQDSTQQGGPHCGADRTLQTQSFACGETITSDITFTGNMECHQSFTGIVIGAPGVDVDLARYEMVSFYSVQDEFDPLPRAIVNDGGYGDLTVRNGTLSNWGTGVKVTGGARTRVLSMDIYTTSASIRIPPGLGVALVDADDSEIRQVLAAGGVGTSDSARVIIADSTAQGQGIIISNSEDSSVIRNLVDNGDVRAFRGLRVSGNRNRIEDNVVSGYFAGISVEAGSGNQVVGNEVFNAFGGPGHGYGDGIWVDAFTNGTLVRANHAHNNGDDGIEVGGVGTTVADNRADNNGDWGIDVVSGVTDGGGNAASGNGNPLQCRNVFCQ